MAEAAEMRGNARVDREREISLSCEIALAAEKRLMRGYALWLRGRHKVASMTAIHHPSRPGLVPELFADMGLEPEPLARAQGERATGTRTSWARHASGVPPR